MGQYHIVVNLSKREYLHPHKLGCGLKQWEQIATQPGTAQALFMLLCGPARGGGDITVPGTEQVVGRWAGDRIALVGDYAAAEDIKDFPYLDCVYSLCHDVKEIEGRIADRGAAGKPRLREAFKKYGAFKDISEIVCKGIEHVFEGKYEGDGWRSFKPGPDSFLNRT